MYLSSILVSRLVEVDIIRVYLNIIEIATFNNKISTKLRKIEVYLFWDIFIVF